MEAIKVLVVDDSTTFLRAAMLTISMLPDVYVVGSARSGANALSATKCRQPDLVLMDVNMPGMDGLMTARRLRTEGYTGKIVFVSMGDAPDAAGCQLGVDYDGFIAKADFAVGFQRVIDDMLASRKPGGTAQ